MGKISLYLILFFIITGCSQKTSQFIEPDGPIRPSIEPLEPNASFVSEEWYDRYDVFEINREPARSSFWPYASKEEAVVAEKSALDDVDYLTSPYVQSLNGTWRFYYASNPSERLKNIAGFDAGSYWEEWNDQLFEDIEVPSNIQTQRKDDGTFKYEKPIYINQIYPWLNYEVIEYGWQGEPLAPTAFNSVGHYKREFELNDSMKDRNIFVSFKGVESAFYLYVNGQRVGYSEDSYTTADFNITAYLKEGTNTIALEVYRWSTGSYFENQDFIRLSGIFRDVVLYSKSKVEIRDIFAQSEISEDYQEAELLIETSVRNLSSTSNENVQVVIDVLDGETSILDSPVVSNLNQLTKIDSLKDEGTIISQTVSVQKPKLWTSEKPNLYQLVIQLIDDKGSVLEVASTRIGIRKVEVKEISGKSQILVNGKPILLKGVNRHETSLINGRAISKEEILYDLKTMKAFNINTFRMAHYPNQEITYDIADEIGLYIVDEANIESHIGEKELSVPGNNSIYTPLILDRTKNMVERDKNHASILFWSLGNESTYNEYPMDENYPFYVSSMWILDRDPSRLRVYERDNRIGKTREESMVDVVSSQYWTIDQINNYGKKEKNAFFQSEYGHAMGNALGNFKEYFDTYRTYANIQGGFIWDYIDQSILTVDEDGNEYFGNGEDWGTALHDGDFCGNGILSANRKPQAESEEVKKVHQDFRFKYNDKSLTVTNESIDTNLNEFDVSIEILNDGEVVYTKTLNRNTLDVEPLSTKKIELELPPINYDGEVLLNVFVKYSENQIWANENGGNKGNIHSKEQFLIRQTKLDLKQEVSGQLKWSGDQVIKVESDDFKFVFDTSKGVIQSYEYMGEEILSNSPELSFYRAPVSNDIQFSEESMNLGKVLEGKISKVNSTAEQVEIEWTGVFEGSSDRVKMKLNIVEDGSVLMDMVMYTPSIKEVGEIARVGVVMNCSSSMDSYSMYGRGPFDNYVDRNDAAHLGIYSGSLWNFFDETQLKPQDSGNRTDVRWFEIQSEKVALKFTSNIGLGVNALPYLDSDIAIAKHSYELKKLDGIRLHLDVEQRGLGNGSWGAEPLEKYKIKQGDKKNIKLLLEPRAIE